MNANEISAAFEHVEACIGIGDNYVRRIVNRHLKNRLQSLQLDTTALRALKRELKTFNARSGTWGDK